MTVDGERPRIRLAAVVGAAAAAIALALLPAASASAHDYLVTSSPAAGSTVRAAPARVTLQFDDVVLGAVEGSTVLQVTGPGSSTRHYETGCPKVLNRTVSAPVSLGAAGTYTATWRIVSADGHPVTNSIAFVYAPPAGATAAHGSAVGPSCGGKRASAPAVASTGEGTSIGIGLGIAGGVFVIALVVTVVVIVLRRPAVPGAGDERSSADESGSGIDPADPDDAPDPDRGGGP